MAQSGAQRKSETVIDENIRKVYDEALQEGVPDRFRDLLDALRKQDQVRDKR